MAWLRQLAWPVGSAVLDGEACAGDGHEGIQAVFAERKRPDGAMALVLFDVLRLESRSIMREPWRDRRKRLEDLVGSRQLPRIGIVPVTDDAAHLYETWVGMGGEGIVLKDPASPYRPGERSPAWLKVKPKLTLEVLVTGGSATRIAWGDWGEAVMLADPAGCPGRAQSAVRAQDRWARRAGLLRRHAERDAPASALLALVRRSSPAAAVLRKLQVFVS
jgi:ATP-dependent DNA ligase